jgi:hypothetical protein
VEGAETVVVTVTSGSGYTVGTASTATVTIADNDGGATPPAITSPAPGTTFSPGQTVTATGTGTNLSWSINRVGDGLPAFATGTGSSITFTVAGDSTTAQSIQITLTGDGGMAEQIHPIGSPVPLTVSLPGVADTTLSQGAPTTNYGGDPTVRADGDEAGGNDLVGLLKFDLTSIPPGSSVQTVELTIVVTNPSGDSYPLYEARRRWVEGEATWEAYASGQAWEVGGAGGTQDRGSAALGTITATAAGAYTLSLSAAAVQGWVDVPGTNHGIVIAHSTNDDGLGFESREAAAANRPSLRVTYAPGPPPPDTDGDGMTDVAEVAMGFDPSNADQDANGRPDGQDDWDADGLTNQAELGAGTPPGSAPGGTGGGGDGSEGCGATGMEAVLALAFLALRRDRR